MMGPLVSRSPPVGVLFVLASCCFLLHGSHGTGMGELGSGLIIPVDIPEPLNLAGSSCAGNNGSCPSNITKLLGNQTVDPQVNVSSAMLPASVPGGKGQLVEVDCIATGSGCGQVGDQPNACKTNKTCGDGFRYLCGSLTFVNQKDNCVMGNGCYCCCTNGTMEVGNSTMFIQHGDGSGVGSGGVNNLLVIVIGAINLNIVIPVFSFIAYFVNLIPT